MVIHQNWLKHQKNLYLGIVTYYTDVSLRAWNLVSPKLVELENFDDKCSLASHFFHSTGANLQQ
jgi:hypothetical protein